MFIILVHIFVYILDTVSNTLVFSLSCSVGSCGSYVKYTVLCLWVESHILFIIFPMSPFTGSSAVAAALCSAIVCIYRSSGAIEASLSNTAVGVRLYPPVIRRRHLFCSRFIGLRINFFAFVPSFYILYIGAVYVIVGRTTAL